MTVKALGPADSSSGPTVLMYGPEPLNPRCYGSKKAAPAGAVRDDGHRENCLSLCPMLPHDQKAAEIWLQRV